jgi:glutamate formiminotransferase/formiminotetrahydrofolate cyclodeaminase
MRLVECVPNFSEGQSKKVIDAIAEAISSVEGVNLLDVDPGKSTNRTVITFVGEPEAVSEAAFQAIAKAQSLIDMKVHKGAHPRIGATDVCPFVPVNGITMEECAELAKQLGARVGSELGIPIYLYAEAAQKPERANLADVRQGEYEGLAERMKNGFKPDFGPTKFNAESGATVIGARPFLIAYNVNLNTKSQKLANEIAMTIREGGRAKRNDAGEIVKDKDGKSVKVPGTLKACKAVGWYIDEYDQAQVSINLVDYKVTSLHHAFDEACKQAEKLGLRVTGSEIVGMVPLEPLLDAGRHYLKMQNRPTGVPDKELIDIAIKSLGLCDVSKFDPQQKVIEYRVSESAKLLKNFTVADFVDEVSSESPAPGGGSVAALMGALSAGLSSMVGNLTFGKKEFAASQPLMDDLSIRAQKLKSEFLEAVDADTKAFNLILQARRLPKDTAADSQARDAAILEASKHATNVPFAVLGKANQALDLAQLAIESGNPNSASDAGVAASSAYACAEGAYLNVLINLGSIEDENYCTQMSKEAGSLFDHVKTRADALHEMVLDKISS